MAFYQKMEAAQNPRKLPVQQKQNVEYLNLVRMKKRADASQQKAHRKSLTKLQSEHIWLSETVLLKKVHFISSISAMSEEKSHASSISRSPPSLALIKKP